VALRHDQGRGAKGCGGTQGRADIVRVGHLIEDKEDAVRVDRIERDRGQGLGFDRHPLMYRVGAQNAVEISRRYRLGLESPTGEGGGEPMSRILGGQHFEDLPPRIAKGGLHGVKAVEKDPIGRLLGRVPLAAPRRAILRVFPA